MKREENWVILINEEVREQTLSESLANYHVTLCAKVFFVAFVPTSKEGYTQASMSKNVQNVFVFEDIEEVVMF